MPTETINFLQSFTAGRDGSEYLNERIEVAVEISHSGGAFLGVRLYHDEYPEARPRLRYSYRAMSRSVIGPGDTSDIEVEHDYRIRTFTAPNPHEAAAKAVNHHLNESILARLRDQSRQLITEDDWYRTAFQDHVVVPLSTVILAMCQDEHLSKLFPNDDPLFVIPRWHIQMAYGPMNQEAQREFASGHFIHDMFVTNDRHARGEITANYSRRR